MLKDIRNNNSGIVFVTVLAIVISMMILTMSVISLNSSQTILVEDEVKRLQAEMLALGYFSYLHSNLVVDPTTVFTPTTQPLGSITYSINQDPIGISTGPLSTNTVGFTITY